MIQPHARIYKNARVVSRKLGDGEGGVVLHLETGQYHGLSEVAWLIWTIIDDDKTLAEIVSELRTSFEPPPAHLEVDIARFLEDLSARDLISISAI